jgi:LacI family transcriptional regulator
VAAYSRFVEDRGIRNYSEFQDLSDAMEVPALDKVHSILDLWQQMGDSAPTALITSDVFALPLLIEARNRGINIPEELSVIGIDNTGPCSLVQPQLTSMEQPFDEMCRSAVEMLLRRREEPTAPSYSVQIAPRLISRKSTCEVNARILEKAR